MVSVEDGQKTLKEAVDAALAALCADTSLFYLIGSAVGPHPYPTMVQDFQRIIGDEARAQMLEREGRLPDAVVACVGGGSNAIGAFTAFIGDKDVRLIGVEPAGRGLTYGATRRPSRWVSPAFSTGSEVICSPTERASPPRYIRSPRGWIIPRLGRRTPTSR